MVMHCRRIEPASGERPWLVCLHGLLGSGEDWRELLPFLRDWPVLLVDLPGHGQSAALNARNFAQLNQQLADTLERQGIRRYWLLGYSLGGRIAMYHACSALARGLQGLLVEGGNPGLESEGEREARLRQDRGWARRFAREALPAVLDDWYRQPVFADLAAGPRQTMIARRSHNQGCAIARMLEATSLARQPFLVDALHRLSVPFGYLCGAQDSKFQALARHYRLPLMTVSPAGHNAHQANPAAYAARILSLITHPSKE
ncbi:2-succinyl-6-hydroxy-2,4-cyclohexadiene-1-carboxylate synthase [Affinibrenneria salicis]|uniref:2-succinyl-6-hydroxy-2, 4-cyclohexadiene-1-carboxylate synthase n=1 Tax=Affinibrenneria salicis TaxID=2590031 RepID=UPI001CC7A59D|nr:2-succinyl-6-hydroxy-2,4-cyclohexadiene-1-carboxylate synthase [Affinibrenneria salicis]